VEVGTVSTEVGDRREVESRFHFTREMIEGSIYRKYEKAIRGVWNAKDFDYAQDAADWQRIDADQRRGLLGVTVRFLAGEQAVTDELVPMLAAATTGRCSCRPS
jgi:ribonucleotide reductase beta subunit family protein with ferritin-like domain